MKEFIVRTISGVLYASILVFSIFFSPLAFTILIVALGLISLSELIKLLALKPLLPYLFSVVLFYVFSFKGLNHYFTIILLGISLITNLALLIHLFSKKNLVTNILSKQFISQFYHTSGFIFISLIPMYTKDFNPKIIAVIFIFIWINDSFAYLIGKNFGKRKLYQRISPNKTVEGFLGGLIATVISSYFIASYIPSITLLNWVILSIITAVFGALGDLIQSKFKRENGVKDSGSLIPGHGGLYDRLDSIIYASPFIYLFLLLINYVS